MKKVIHISEVLNHKVEILEVFKSGGVVLYPTDTQYALGVMVTDEASVQKVNDIKSVVGPKPVSVIVSDIQMAERYVDITPKARALMEEHLPGALTLLLPAIDPVLAKSIGNEAMIGVRIPARPEMLDIVSELDTPITTTSANISGEQPSTDYKVILENLHNIDLVIVGEDLTNTASTIVKIEGDTHEIIRQGTLIVE